MYSIKACMLIPYIRNILNFLEHEGGTSIKVFIIFMHHPLQSFGIPIQIVYYAS